MHEAASIGGHEHHHQPCTETCTEDTEQKTREVEPLRENKADPFAFQFQLFRDGLVW